MVLVFSCGRTGTNLILEVLSGSSLLAPFHVPEDKQVFTSNFEYPPEYVCKCDTVYCKDYDMFKRFMSTNLDAKVIWTIRDPRDTCMSKIARGYHLNADDGTPNGAIKDMQYMVSLYIDALRDYEDRILTVKMEDVILDVEKEAKRMCKFLKIPYESSMKFPHIRMRDVKKKRRYDTLDKEQIGLWKEWKTAYGGFFTANKEIDIEDIFEKVKSIRHLFDY